ncbi:MAG: SPASM domain-containing protein [Phycisphaerales bacterium]|nr:SPASM domain-containing protein [Phycisphaerales bacterium]
MVARRPDTTTENRMMSLPIISAPPLAECGQGEATGARADWHEFTSKEIRYLLAVDASRVYRLDAATPPLIDAEAFLELGIPNVNAVEDPPPEPFPMRSLSLAVAQKCNLGCTYCYAEGGSFGETPRNMSAEVALMAVDRLLAEATSGDKIHLAFLGGEPLVNRPVLRQATEYAAREASKKHVRTGFSVTTNGTLLTPDDGAFFEHHGFAVTISLDGIGAVHDRQRPFKNGRGTYQGIMEHVTPLLNKQRHMQVSARVTVTPRNLCLRETLDELIGLGFYSVGFSPMLSSPTGRDQMHGSELDVMLDQMKDCGREFERSTIAGRRYPFSNMTNAMQEIHRGTHRPYPCGAGAGYFGVSSDGELFACHRFVGDESWAMGTVGQGVDHERRQRWLAERHVHFQEPCKRCWARYLCGGGCHHEVIHRGRPACDYIRGWLHFCLQAYVRLLESRPDYFDPSASPDCFSKTPIKERT